MVAPLAGARIEIALSVRLRLSQIVAPLAGARIEIAIQAPASHVSNVAPLAGARIEIVVSNQKGTLMMSLPSRERGLK